MSTVSYLGNAKLKSKGVKLNFTKEQIEEIIKCSNDPVYFIEKYVKIVSLDDGVIPFKFWPFQQNLLETVHKNRFVICKFPRQTGKSTTIISYLLHYVLFNESKKVAILANKASTARELLHRLQLAYELLPLWLQQGIVTWNKGDIELENGSRIVATSTSGDSVRGDSYNCILLDEFAHVPNNIAEDFFTSTYPVISSGKTTKVIIVSTPKGLNHFYKFWVNATEKKNSYIPIEVHWSEVPGRDEEWKKETIANTSQEQFDQEFGIEFIGSTNTLIKTEILKNFAWKDPLYAKNGLDIFEKPIEDHAYCICVDTSRGQGLDYSAFIIIDVTKIPYKIVGKYRNNEISSLLYPNIIHELANTYVEASILVEINDIGQQVADILHHDLEYDNIIWVQMMGRAGQLVGGGFGKGKSMPGVKTSPAVKKIGCSNLKTMIENHKLLFDDFDIIMELNSFVSKNNSYQAEEGMHDDLVMCMVLFGWLVNQKYFKESTNQDLREKLYSEKVKDLEENLLPFGFIDNGLNSEKTYVGDGAVWTIVE